MPVKFKETPTTFYLGRRVDPGSGAVSNDPIYYDSRDLTTHAVVVGMTGSGKTGLCITLLEEAILDNIPSVIIDPKGDITNLMLQFPQLRPEDFRPWVNVDDARREHMEPDQYAEAVAKKWKDGLAESGIVPGRIQALKNAAEISIYTPGSDAGLPVSILNSLQTPREGWAGYEEAHRERINGTVTALLALIGKDADPVKDREHVLIANIFEDAWRNGRDLTLEAIILQVQNPPFTKLGVFDIDTFFPQKDRFKLAKELNQIIAAPSFQTWMQGDALDMRSLLHTETGKPHVAIFYVAHLSDAERAFVITLLLENMLSWMRTLSGTTSLRALLYFDEIFGFFPPAPFNPPTKGPMLRLLKQARAFGLGVVVATQNPVDLDYKGLSNAGTWFIGKLQTDNDRRRMLGGLESAVTADAHFNAKEVDELIKRLDKQEFVLHNIHNEAGPLLFQTRWAMSYLRGPLARQQVRQLMESQRVARFGAEQVSAEQYTGPQNRTIIDPKPGNVQVKSPPVVGTPPPPMPRTAPPGNSAPPTLPLPPVAPNVPLNPPSPAAGLFSGVKPAGGSTGTTRPPAPQPDATPSGIPRVPAPPTVPEERAAPGAPASTFGSGWTGASRSMTPPPPSSPDEAPASAPATPAKAAPAAKRPASAPPASAPDVNNTMASGAVAASDAAGRPRTVPEGFSEQPVAMVGNTAQYFLPVTLGTKEAIRNWEQKFGVAAVNTTDAVLIYRPVLLAQTMARYIDRKANVQEDQLHCYQVPDLDHAGFVNWAQFETLPVDPVLLQTDVPRNAWFGPVASGITDQKRLTALKTEVVDFVYRNASMPLFYNSTLDLYGLPGETKRDYSIRLQEKAREARDQEIDKVTAKYDKEIGALDAKIKKEMRDHTTDLRLLDELKREETYTTGEAVFRLMRGRPAYTLSRVSRARRMKTGVQERAFGNEQVIADLEQALDAKQEELRNALTTINQKWATVASTIEETKVTPLKKDIALQLFGIGWVPAWSLSVNGQNTIVNAT